jgi:hypothetical protein
MISTKSNTTKISENEFLAKKQSRLEDKIAKIGGKLMPIAEWDDNIADDIKDEGQLSIEIINGKVLQIDGKREIGYAKFGEKTYQVCYRWIPLSYFHNYEECFSESWRKMFKGSYFALILGDDNIDSASSTLKGFVVADIDGF